MDPVYEVEQRCADAWPAQVDERLGAWRLRAAGGFTGRANSALTCGDPGIPVPDALDRVKSFAHRHGIPPTAHVVRDAEHETAIAAAGWTVNQDHPGGAESGVLTGSLNGFNSPPVDGVAISDVPTPGWWELTAQPNPTPAQRHVLASGTGSGFGTITHSGKVVAAVRGAISGDLLHIARLAVHPTHRRHGLARALLANLATWATKNGATRCALQVAEHNTAAWHLYTSLGCTEHHRYRYWIPK
ncbi:GNAT family N-acetyltransferase [Umezawaea tangerina]|uniref:Acetyltransferase (GNAT) family protein n=1 Tax=Umezawaea tangerina TaxID=84725 RepID=A0A2T0TM82_9PSEU|nr:GNAT family N-acetyltransferase [Umezawaea tangerina]PRY46776.1 acetyltransferase (GNAT) family protein [Umezawaea tangerina]